MAACRLDVTIPANTSAVVTLPGAMLSQVKKAAHRCYHSHRQFIIYQTLCSGETMCSWPWDRAIIILNILLWAEKSYQSIDLRVGFCLASKNL